MQRDSTEEAGKHGKVKDKWDNESKDVFKHPGIRYLCHCRVLPHRNDTNTPLVCP